MSQQPSKAITLFYTALSMLKSADYYMDYLLKHEPDIHYHIGGITKWIMRKHDEYFKQLYKGVEQKDKAIWNKDWKEGEYLTFASVWELLARMDNDTRAIYEQIGEEIVSGGFLVEPDFLPITEDNKPKEGQTCLIVTYPPIIVYDATFHNDKIGFFSYAQKQYVTADKVALWKPLNIHDLKLKIPNASTETVSIKG